LLGPFDENDTRISFGGIAISNFAVQGGVLDTPFLKDFPDNGVVIELYHRRGVRQPSAGCRTTRSRCRSTTSTRTCCSRRPSPPT